jgi:hypothetical protein
MPEEFYAKVFALASNLLGKGEEAVRIVAGVLSVSPDELKVAIEKTRRKA